LTSKCWLATVCGSLLVGILLLGCGVFQAIAIVRERDYTEVSADPAVELQDSAFRARNESCDVLVDGDSTAAVGIDPRVLTAQTGLSACNIATSRPIVDDLGTLPLDTFLQNNPRPKLLVLQYGAEDFYRSDRPWLSVGPYLPLVMIARNRPRREVLGVMLRHPAETVQFVFYVFKVRLLPPHGGRETAMKRYRRALVHAAASRGQFDLDLNLAGQTECGAAPPLHGPLDSAWIRQLRERYERQGITVLIRAAPVPACDVRLAQFEHELAPYVDGNVESLPVSLFASGDRHPTQPGSQIATLGLVALINAHEPLVVASARTGRGVSQRGLERVVALVPKSSYPVLLAR